MTERSRRLGRVTGLVALAGLAWSVVAPPLSADEISQLALRDDAQHGRTHLFAFYYRTGVARLGRGDPAGALAIFETASVVAPDLPQLQYCFGLALVLVDFSRRERALAPIRRAVAATPADPLFRIMAALADPDVTALGPDGGLYFTQEGARIVDQEAPRLAGLRDAYNGKYLALLLSARQPTGTAALPERLPGFAAMLGTGTGVALPEVREKLSLGRLLEVAVPDTMLQPYEVAFVDRLLAGRVADAGAVQAAR
jgi:hypothetical protein